MGAALAGGGDLGGAEAVSDLTEHGRRNRAHWDATADEYQERHGVFIGRPEPRWGIWQIPESELQILGDLAGQDVLELGCGAAQWSILLAQRGARPVGLDNSERQLEHARRAMAAAGVDFPLVHASAESVPLEDESFDVVFCDHGAFGWADPRLVMPEAARLLRHGGVLAFSVTSPIASLCFHPDTELMEPVLHRDYFGLHRLASDGTGPSGTPHEGTDRAPIYTASKEKRRYCARGGGRASNPLRPGYQPGALPDELPHHVGPGTGAERLTNAQSAPVPRRPGQARDTSGLPLATSFQSGSSSRAGSKNS